MHILAVISLFIITSWVGYGIYSNRQVGMELKGVLWFALIFSTWYNVNHNPHLVLWLCNITCLIAIYLTVRFHQRLFDIFFFLVWSGDLFTLLIIDNPVCPPLKTASIYWLAFYLKHVGPILFTLYLIIRKNKRVRKTGLKDALSFMFSYAIIIFIYDIMFNQNILDLMEPTLDIERMFGPWPIYVIVNILLAILWFWGIQVVGMRIGIVKK
ncbi:MAG: YwaF family protein [Candidatus Marinimicrobia bacterium]|nr:YwaF family protein [Candidatus Neomarinimicrobiota bacterium]